MVVSLFRGFAQHEKGSRWDSRFSKTVRQLIKLGSVKGASKPSPVQQIKQALDILKPYVDRRSFLNAKEDEVYHAKADLLMLWKFLIDFCAKTDSTTIQTLSFELIRAIMQRGEFSLISLGYGSDDEPQQLHQRDVKVMRKYQELLICTFILVMETLNLNKENLMDIVKFCAEVLAILFFRLPSVGARMVASLKRTKAAGEEMEHLFSKHKQRTLQKDQKAKIVLSKLKNFLLETSDTTTEISSTVSESPILEATQPDVAVTDELTFHPLFLVENDENEDRSILDESSRNLHFSLRSKRSGSTSSRKSKRSNEGGKWSKRSISRSFRDRFLTLFSKGERATTASSKTFTSICADSDCSADFIQRNPDLFRWSLFSSTLETRKLEEYLKTKDCDRLDWIEQKPSFLITFIDAFVSHVKTVAVNGQIDWSAVASYDLIIECFWPLFTSYLIWYDYADKQPERGIGFVKSGSAASFVLSTTKEIYSTNPFLLNDFVLKCLSETNVLSQRSVVLCLDHILSLFRYGWENNGIAPGSFLKPKVYWFGIEKMLEQEDYTIIMTVLFHLYDAHDFLSGEFREVFYKKILKKFFFKLFFHWYQDVRCLFQALLVFKCYKTNRKHLVLASDNEMNKRFPRSFGRFQSPSGEFIEEAKNDDEEENTAEGELLVDIGIKSQLEPLLFVCLKDKELLSRQHRSFLGLSLRSYALILNKYYSGSKLPKASDVARLLESLNKKKQISPGV